MKLLFLVVVGSFLWISYSDNIVSAASTFFRPDYIYNGDFSSFYKVHTIRRNWTDAKVRCLREGASIFYPETQAESEYAVSLLKDKLPNYPHVWTGITDIVSEGEFETVTGKLIEEIYIDWDNNEPKDETGEEDCLILAKNGKMSAMECKTKNSFICKKTLATLEWNHLCDIPDPSYKYNGELGKCYKFHVRPLSWAEAHSVCIAEQSYLAVINSQKEADYFVELTNANKDKYKGRYLSGAVHLGFHKKLGGDFVTVHGIPLEDSGYAVWGNGQPDWPNDEFCGSMFYNGRLNDLMCYHICYFICEHDIGILSGFIDDRISNSTV